MSDMVNDLKEVMLMALLADVRKCRVDTGIELVVSLINKHYSWENMRMRRRYTWVTVRYKSRNQ